MQALSSWYAHLRWEPRRRRPELWRIPSTLMQEGESIPVVPHSKRTELVVRLHIRQEHELPGSLHLRAARPVVRRDGALILVDHDRLPLIDHDSTRSMEKKKREGCL